MTIEDAIVLIRQTLQEQGQLRNGQILRMLNHDETMLREVREALIFDDIAHDKNGVGLVLASRSPSYRAPPPSHSLPKPSLTSLSPAPPLPESAASDLPVAETPCSAASSWEDMVREVKAEIQAERQGRPRPQVRTDNLTERTERRAPSLTPVHPAPIAVGEARQFFTWAAGAEAGPFSWTEIESRLAAGSLSLTDFAKRGTDAEWVPLAEALEKGPVAITAENRPSGESPRLAVVDPSRQVDPPEETPTRLTSELGRNVPRSLGTERRSRSTPTTQVNVSSPRESSVGTERRPLSTSPPRRVDNRPSWASPSKVSHGRMAAMPAPVTSASPVVALWFRAEGAIGRTRMRAILAVAMAATCFVIAWSWPPSARSVLKAFDACHADMMSLRNGGCTEEVWRKAAGRHRRIVASLVASLRSRVKAGGGPEIRELLWAGELGLLPMLGGGMTSVAGPDQWFALHRDNARRYLDGQEPLSISAPPQPDLGAQTSPIASAPARQSPYSSPDRNGVVYGPPVPPGAPGSQAAWSPR